MTNVVAPVGTPVAVEPYEPRYHWPSIVAGSFVALALFVVSVILARACDVDVTFQNATTTGAEAGAIIWGGVSALICFGIGGLVAGRGAVAARRRMGWLNGLIVWAVAVPVLVYGLGAGIGPRLGQTVELGRSRANGPSAIQASARMNPVDESQMPQTTGSSTYMSHPQAAAWWMLLSLGLGLFAASAMGAVAGRAVPPSQDRP